jgi:tRNA(fMet)-specific endonuclease VapC
VYLLDTDIISLYLHHPGQNPRLVARIQNTPYRQIYISTITIEEGLAGAERFKGRDLTRHSEILTMVVQDYGRFQILPFSTQAVAIYKAMPEKLKQHHRNDWKIAAIALGNDFTVVTRNVIHFAAVEPNVRIEDWTRKPREVRQRCFVTPTCRQYSRTGHSEHFGSLPVQMCFPNGTSRRLISTQYCRGRTSCRAAIVISGVFACT